MAELTNLLNKAAAGNEKQSATDFFRALLSSQVFVVYANAASESPTIVGQGSADSLGLLSVKLQGRVLVPVFTEETMATFWSEGRYRVGPREFKSLIWGLGDSTWVYLNPSQEVGKEFSPWEIEQLRKGEDALEEIISELFDEGDGDVEVRPLEIPNLQELILSLTSILESYPDINEGFLIGICSGSSPDVNPVLGIKKSELSPEKGALLREEIYALRERFFPPNFDFVVIDDLADSNSPNGRLFAEATPFYIAQKELSQSPISVKGLLKRFGIKSASA